MNKRKKEKLDWRRSIEEHSYQETAAEEMASLIPTRIRYQAYAVASIFGMMSMQNLPPFNAAQDAIITP